MRSDPAGGALFDASAHPIGASPWLKVELMFKDRPICRVLMPIDGSYDPTTSGVDLICALPAGGPAPIADSVLGHLVAAVDGGAAVALHGTQDDAICAAVDAVMAMVGGGR